MIDLSNLVTASSLVTELGIAQSTATTLLKETGKGVKIGNTVLYDRRVAQQAVATKNAKVLEFLGYPVSLSESYDVDVIA